MLNGNREALRQQRRQLTQETRALFDQLFAKMSDIEFSVEDPSESAQLELNMVNGGTSHADGKAK